ncbi:hypothetical protein HELRODRAFT_125752, partial [Helobdella robusta]|uniref:Mpv17-like protein 2 n=1 Tax=Helobdella robusta TaxID=6412 RepID=T1EH73_HELRO
LSQTLFSPRYLLVTNTSIGFLTGAVGDSINQNVGIPRKKNVDDYKWSWSRFRNQCAQGSILGAAYHFWYLFLDRKLPGTSSSSVIKKVFADQVIMCPIAVVFYLGLLNLLEGGTLEEGMKSLKEKSGQLLLAEWTFGPLSQLINFYIIPCRFRVLYDSIVVLSFDSY